jgi:tryptophanyl-tRNA synthetase
MTRKFANRFNRIYEVDYFTVPQPFSFGKSLLKIPGLDGSGKMGKSEGNGIFLAEDPASIRKKVMKAVTDSGPAEPNSPVSEPIQNLFTLMEAVSESGVAEQFKDDYAKCTIRYGDLKKKLAEDIIAFTTPLRERIQAIAADDAYLKKVANMGREKAHASASKTVKEVREIIGFKSF